MLRWATDSRSITNRSVPPHRSTLGFRRAPFGLETLELRQLLTASPSDAFTGAEIHDCQSDEQTNPVAAVSAAASVEDPIGEASAPGVENGATLDVNQNGQIDPIDALQVINALFAQSEPERFPEPPPISGVDVNHDGMLSVLDALLVINALPPSTMFVTGVTMPPTPPITQIAFNLAYNASDTALAQERGAPLTPAATLQADSDDDSRSCASAHEVAFTSTGDWSSDEDACEDKDL